MDLYSLEKLHLDRHREMIERAEARSKLAGWESGGRLAERLASQLRRLADRLDGRVPTHVASPMFRRLDT